MNDLEQALLSEETVSYVFDGELRRRIVGALQSILRMFHQWFRHVSSTGKIDHLSVVLPVIFVKENKICRGVIEGNCVRIRHLLENEFLLSSRTSGTGIMVAFTKDRRLLLTRASIRG